MFSFNNWFCRFSVPMWKASCSQLEVHFQEIFNGKKDMSKIFWSILNLNFKTNPQNDEVRRKMETAAFLGEIWMRAVPVHFEERRTSHEHLEEEKGICRGASHEEKRKRGLGGICWGEKFDRWGWSKQLGRVGTLKRQELEARYWLSSSTRKYKRTLKGTYWFWIMICGLGRESLLVRFVFFLGGGWGGRNNDVA